jgi:hypothetical protein
MNIVSQMAAPLMRRPKHTFRQLARIALLARRFIDSRYLSSIDLWCVSLALHRCEVHILSFLYLKLLFKQGSSSLGSREVPHYWSDPGGQKVNCFISPVCCGTCTRTPLHRLLADPQRGGMVRPACCEGLARLVGCSTATGKCAASIPTTYLTNEKTRSGLVACPHFWWHPIYCLP